MTAGLVKETSSICVHHGVVSVGELANTSKRYFAKVVERGLGVGGRGESVARPAARGCLLGASSPAHPAGPSRAQQGVGG